MPKHQTLDVAKISLDLRNYRSTPQRNENASARAMAAVAPTKFRGLIKSILDDGYMPNENIIVLRDKTKGLVVKEGNRRVACLKLIQGMIPIGPLDLPDDLVTEIGAKTKAWLSGNRKMSCFVYEPEEVKEVNAIVRRTHGKGQAAGRDDWASIARARHNREENGGSEPGLDLFEKYLNVSKNHTKEQSEKWSGSYEITILDEALKKIAPRLGLKSARELADKYPKLSKVNQVDKVVLDIGLGLIGFKELRVGDILERYGIPDPTPPSGPGPTGGPGPTSGPGPTGGPNPTGRQPRGPNKTFPANDPRSVKKILTSFAPKGKNHQKLATLADELRSMNMQKTPHAFCFVLRSVFEVAGKQFADKHTLRTTDPKTNNDISLLALLKSCLGVLTQGLAPRDPLMKELHGAIQELAKTHGILSITSLNQLVHNPRFSAIPSDISITFHNVYPLLEHLTR